MRDSLVVVVGEAVIDLVPLAGHTYDAKPGGSPTNVAVGLARLGQEIELLGRLGQGAFGDIVREHVHANGVGTRFAVAANEPATLAVVTLDDAGQAAYTFYAEGTSDWSWTAEELAPGFASEPLAVVAGSITLGREPGASAVGSALHRLHESGAASIVLDPNLRPQLIGSRQRERDRWAELVRLADIVKVSDEDLRWLLPDTDPLSIARSWVQGGTIGSDDHDGPGLIVVTRGSQGATAVSRAGVEATVPVVPVDVVDTVGAGDAFTAGWVHAAAEHGLLGPAVRSALDTADHELLTRLLRFASAAAAITCGRAGADPPTTTEVRAVVDATDASV